VIGSVDEEIYRIVNQNTYFKVPDRKRKRSVCVVLDQWRQKDNANERIRTNR
jgi:hypothetical protein